MNQQGVTGWEVPPKDPIALRTKIISLKNDDALCARMGKAALKRYQTHFTHDNTLKAYESVYTACIQEMVK